VTRRSLGGWAFIAFPLGIIFVFTALPTLVGAGLSFFDWDGGGMPRFVGIENYRSAVARDPQLWLALRNTVLFALGTVPLTVVGAFLIAVAVNASWFRGRAAARTVFFLPTVMSIVAVGFIWQWMLNPRAGLLEALLGPSGQNLPDFLADSWLGLATLIIVQVWRNLGFCVVLYVAAIWALQVFDLDLVMSGWSPQRFNDMLNTHIFREFKNGRLGYSATIGVVLLSLIAAVTWAQFRWLRAAGGARA
jgi:multiple sugar transport system permease protein